MAPPIVAVSPAIRRALWETRIAGGRQADIAKKAGLHPSTVSQIVNGLVPVYPGDPRVRKLAEALGVPFADAFITRRAGTDR